MFSAVNQSTGTLVWPGRYLDWYPEKVVAEQDFFQASWAQLRCKRQEVHLRFRTFSKIAKEIESAERTLATLSAGDRAKTLHQLQVELKRSGFTRDNLVQTLGLASVEVRAEFGFTLHREQLFCAWALLNGTLAEMATGEGKSITAAVAAIVAALSGTAVHVITTNDYLVERDASSMQPLFARLGLTCSYVTPDQSDDERRAAYASPICYVSNKQLAFDYLRDRQVLGNRPGSLAARTLGLRSTQPAQPLLKGLCFAIVDEADSVLIDDAITPLVLSQQIQGERDVAQSVTAISLASRLNEQSDFNIDKQVKRLALTEQGEEHLSELVSGLEGVWKNRRFRHELVRQALSAIHLFKRDVDYLVREGEVVLVDQSTGRVMADRKLQHGLHQMVEMKEKCELSGQAETIASISFQNLFRRYHHLCGMTGTAAEVSTEFRRVYGLAVVKVPTHQTNLRTGLPPQFGANEQSHNYLLLQEIQSRHKQGQPLLVGTRSLAQSERISAVLKKAKLKHAVLNARQDQDEAVIVEQAAQLGSITIATNIAGRGTDIPTNADVRTLGGLHVIVAELNDNQRIDRQLIGRTARQGDPGSFTYILSLEDELLHRFIPHRLLRFLADGFLTQRRLWHRVCMYLSKLAQNRNAGQQCRLRKQVAASDVQMHKRLSFTGHKE